MLALHVEGACRWRPRVLHVHHGLQPAADDWASHLQALCSDWGLPLTVLRVEVRPAGDGPEAAARRARYEALADALVPGEWLATGHHADDQAETLLLRLIRGGGLPGAAAMPGLRALGAGWLWRPLLGLRRADIDAYVARAGLPAVRDPHNDDPRYARSRLRAQVMPVLEALQPGAVDALRRFSEHARAASGLLDEAADVWLDNSRGRQGLPIAALLALPEVRRHWFLRRHLLRHGLTAPGEAWLRRLDDELLRAGPDRHPGLAAGPGILACRHDGELLLRRTLASVPPGWGVSWDGGQDLELPGGAGRLSASGTLPAPIAVAFARGGESLRPEGDRHQRRLKQLCQRDRVPVWLRDRLPVLRGADGGILQIANWQAEGGVRCLGGGVTWSPPNWRCPSDGFDEALAGAP